MIDLRPVLYVVGMLLAAIAAAMLLPVAVDLIDGNADWQVFAVSAAATGFAGVALVFTFRPGGRFDIDMRQAFLSAALAWMVTAAFSALPFLFIERGLSYADAFFEAVSGLTTTGSTVIEKLDSLPRGVLLWRSLLQWIGGIGIVVMAITILPFLRLGGMQLFRTESSDRSEKVAPRPGELVGYIALTCLTLSVACAAAYWLAGMSGFDAINHAMSTVATGGFSTRDASFGHFSAPAIHWIGAVFMLAGALPFTAYIRTVQGRYMPLWRDGQVRAFVAFVLLVSLCLGLHVWQSREVGIEEAMRLATFNVVSIVTALSGAAQALGNVGPGLGAIIGPAGNFAPLSDGAKWLLSFGMLPGRLEPFTLLVLLQRSFWRW